MFNNLTYKKKCYVLLLAFLILIYISYKFAVKRTIESVQQYHKALQSEILYERYIKELANLGKLNDSIDIKTVYDVNENTDTRGLILESLIPYCSKYNIVFVHVSPTYFFYKEQFQIETIIVKLAGSFKDLLQLTYAIEKNKEIGKLSSVSYYTDINRNNRKVELYAELYIQNIKNKK